MEDLEIDLQDGGPVALTDEENSEVEDAPVVKYIQKILIDAINLGVSDIHFEPYEKFYRIRYRLDGILSEVAQPPLVIKDKMASRIKVISKLDISEKRVPQDGRMKLVLSKSKAIDFRVSTLPTLFGEKIVMRILDSAGVKLGIEALGYDPDQQEQIMFAIGRPYGMILVTGPTGSGKTVSLYTCLNILNQPGINISTAEDPAEIQLPGVNQVNVNEKAGLTFATALRVVPAPGSGHHHGRRNPRPRDRRHRDQGGADGPPRDVDAAHQRCAGDADAAPQHGRRAVQRRVVGHPDHRAAARPPAVRATASSRRTSRPRRSPRRLRRGGASTARGSRSARSAATSARAPATRAASASTR